MGYSLTGDIREKCLFLLQGERDCGKTLLINVLTYVLGPYARSADWSAFTVHNTKGLEIREDIARLSDARFVSTSEGDKGIKWSEGLVKKLTGRNIITARHLHKGSFEYVPKFKLWFETNFLPKTSSDDAMWSRIRLILFTVTIPEERQDHELEAKLKTEASGIFQWILEGCEEWMRDGLKTPDIVRQATKKYRDDSDNVTVFLREHCKPGAGLKAGKTDTFRAYHSWAQSNEEGYILNAHEFEETMTRRGYENHRYTSGMCWQGFELVKNTSGF